MPRFLTGAKPTPRHKLAGATPHVVTTPTPPEFLWLPKQLDMWGNATFGDCVTAEEAFAKACHDPEIFIPAHKIIRWARNHFVLNGAGLWEVLDLMVRNGIDHGEVTYKDGPFKSVDWCNEGLLQNAIAQGPVKIGVAAGQLQNVPNIGVSNGWIATGFTEDQNLDHCVSLAGYGPYGWLLNKLGVGLSDKIPASTREYLEASNPIMYALFTWSTVGIIDFHSMCAITGEAWLRTPTTIEKADTI